MSLRLNYWRLTTHFLESEAMFMQFSYRSRRKYAIRPYFGGVNGISGQDFIDDTHYDSLDSGGDSLKQDYVVVPDQKRLDGVAVRPGVVKQFVAAELSSFSKQVAKSRSSSKSPNNSTNTVGREARETFQPIGETIEWQGPIA